LNRKIKFEKIPSKKRIRKKFKKEFFGNSFKNRILRKKINFLGGNFGILEFWNFGIFLNRKKNFEKISRKFLGKKSKKEFFGKNSKFLILIKKKFNQSF
jgi:hypothetical protein